MIAPDEKNLVQAWARDQCIFRELVPVGSDKLASAMAALRGRKPALQLQGQRTATRSAGQRIQETMRTARSINLTTKRFPSQKSGSPQACPIRQT